MIYFDEYDRLRHLVLIAARKGRATYLPAGARNQRCAQIYVDGELVGESVTIGHYVRPEDGPKSTFQEVKLIEGYGWQIPDRLKAKPTQRKYFDVSIRRHYFEIERPAR